MCTRTLSWWKRILFFFKWRRFSLISSLNRCWWFRVYPKKTLAITLPADFTTFDFFGARSPSKTHCFLLFLCLWSVVVYPGSVHSYVSTRKRARIATEKRQSNLRVDHTITFILLWEQTPHPSFRNFFQTQFFVQNLRHCTFTVTQKFDFPPESCLTSDVTKQNPCQKRANLCTIHRTEFQL